MTWEPPPGTSTVYLCAAVSQIDACERDPSGSARINVENTIAVAERCAAAGAFVVFLSTTMVGHRTKSLSLLMTTKFAHVLANIQLMRIDNMSSCMQVL